MGRGFNNQMLPPPPPGWDRPWVHGQQPPHMGPMENFGMESNINQDRDPDKVLGDSVLGRITEELKEIIKRDLNKKVIETMAFKVYEAWWDNEQVAKNPKPLPGTKPLSTSLPPVKTEAIGDLTKDVKPTIGSKPTHTKMPALLNTFDPLNWAKGSLEMDGFRIGLGFRSAISKMPSFRVKKRSPSPSTVAEKKAEVDSVYRKNKGELLCLN